MNKAKLIVWILVLVVIAGIGWYFFRNSGGGAQKVFNADAIDTVGDFYDKWLAAAQSSTTDPYKEGLAEYPTLSKSVVSQLKLAQTNNGGIDPVLCQTKVPQKIVSRNVYVRDDSAEVLVTSSDKSVTEQAIITLAKQGNGWYINKIECAAGEFAPKKEFSFEKSGNLLKGSMPPPYNTKYWHLIYEENGVAGNAVPLFFDSTSECTDLSGTKATCDQSKLTEAQKVNIRGQLTEKGVNVKQLEFVK